MIFNILIKINGFTWYYVQILDGSVITITNNLLTHVMLNLVGSQLLIFKLNIEMRY